MTRGRRLYSGRALGILAALATVAALWIGVARGSHVTASRYVGAEYCRRCHEVAYQRWRSTAHARALDALQGRERSDPKCLHCHATDPRSEDPALAGVQCEACHGGGKHYSPSYVMRDQELRELLGFRSPDADSCKRCHTETTPSMLPFRFEEKFELIRHDEP
jgi:hypothetical protein